MTLSETAEYVDKALTSLTAEIARTTGEVAALITASWTEVWPVVQVLQKHGVRFTNPKVEGWTRHGLLIGRTREARPRLSVLRGNIVYYMGVGADVLEDAEAVPLQSYLDIADFELLEAGFNFVRGVIPNVVEPFEEKARELREFLESKKAEG